MFQFWSSPAVHGNLRAPRVRRTGMNLRPLLLAVLPLIALFLVIQRFWSLDLLSGAVKS